MTFISFVLLFSCSWTLILEENALVAAQRCGPTRERWAWTDHTCEEQDEYIEAVRALQADGTYGQFVRVHRDMNNVAHGVAEFLPWHRWFIYRFEDALRRVSSNPCITLPYWDWEDSTVFDEDTFDWFDGTFEGSSECKWETVTGNCLRRDMNPNISMWRSGQILGMIMNFDQYADEFSTNSRRNNGFRAALEGAHSAPHAFIGGPMLDRMSASDPLFFVHHANVDRIWSLWQDYYDHDQLDILSYDTPVQYEAGLLDVPMGFGRSRLFRLDNGRSPTPRDVLSNNGSVNVLYRNDQLARRLSYVPNPDWIESAARGSDRVWCDRVSFRRERKNRELLMGRRFRGEQLVKDTPEKSQKVRPTEEIQKKISSSVSPSSIRGSSVHEKIIERPELSKYSVFINVENCLESNDFSDEDEQRIWDKHCEEISLSTTLADRMAFLAREECNERGNPFSASVEFIRTTNMENELVAFECFHFPDKKA